MVLAFNRQLPSGAGGGGDENVDMLNWKNDVVPLKSTRMTYQDDITCEFAWNSEKTCSFDTFKGNNTRYTSPHRLSVGDT